MRYLWTLLVPLLLLSHVMVSADTLEIDSGKKDSGGVVAKAPAATRGMTMSQVEQKFGAPVNKLAAVGDPPIARWEYAEYTVYFEHHLVLTSVINRGNDSTPN